MRKAFSQQTHLTYDGWLCLTKRLKPPETSSGLSTPLSDQPQFHLRLQRGHPVSSAPFWDQMAPCKWTESRESLFLLVALLNCHPARSNNPVDIFSASSGRLTETKASFSKVLRGGGSDSGPCCQEIISGLEKQFDDAQYILPPTSDVSC